MIYDTNDTCDAWCWGGTWRLAYSTSDDARNRAKQNTCKDSPPCGANERPPRWRLRRCETSIARDARNTRTRGGGRLTSSPQLTLDRFLHTLHRSCKRGYKCI